MLWQKIWVQFLAPYDSSQLPVTQVQVSRDLIPSYDCHRTLDTWGTHTYPQEHIRTHKINIFIFKRKKLNLFRRVDFKNDKFSGNVNSLVILSHPEVHCYLTKHPYTWQLIAEGRIFFTFLRPEWPAVTYAATSPDVWMLPSSLVTCADLFWDTMIVLHVISFSWELTWASSHPV